MFNDPAIPRFEYPDDPKHNICSRCDQIIDTEDMLEPACNCISEVESMSLDEYSNEYENLPIHIRQYFSPPIVSDNLKVEFFRSIQKWVVSKSDKTGYEILKGFNTKEEAQSYFDFLIKGE